jgi:transposase
VTDRDGAFFVLRAAYGLCDRLQLIWADMGYRGEKLKAWVEQELEWKMEIVQRPRKWGWYPKDVEPEPMPAFTVLRRRWVVERTFAGCVAGIFFTSIIPTSAHPSFSRNHNREAD